MHTARHKVVGRLCGAYVLVLQLRKPVRVNLGALGARGLKAGYYLYVGSARRGIEARVARHRRLAATRAGKPHWHIDCLLLHPQCKLLRVHLLHGEEECVVSQSIEVRPGVGVPVPGFGSTDCRSGCEAHLYLVKSTYRRSAQAYVRQT